jgi:hypothetical protein
VVGVGEGGWGRRLEVWRWISWLENFLVDLVYFASVVASYGNQYKDFYGSFPSYWVPSVKSHLLQNIQLAEPFHCTTVLKIQDSLTMATSRYAFHN